MHYTSIYESDIFVGHNNMKTMRNLSLEEAMDLSRDRLILELQ
jgi:hypothetical protein